MIASVREQLFLKIIIAKYFSVIIGGHDPTHLLYTLKSKPESYNYIVSIIQSKDLFILS